MSGPVRVRVRLFWWGGDVGRLVLVRTIDHWDFGTCEVWWSGEYRPADVAGIEFLLRTTQWRQLMAGAPVDWRALLIPLYLLSEEDDGDDQDAISNASSRSDFHLLASTHTLAQESAVIAADPPVVGAHQLSNLFPTVPGLPPTGVAHRSGAAPSSRAVYEVTLSDVRGVMIGDGNVQLNRFDITVPDLDFDLEKLLARPAVEKAVEELALDPSDEKRREALIDALAQPSWTFAWNPAHLIVTDPGTMRNTDFLAGLLGFNFGVVAGDGNHQTNHFTHVVSGLPGAQSLLADNTELAAAVAGLLFPEGATVDTGALLAIVNSAVADLPVHMNNDRLQLLNLTPKPLTSLTGVDGAMVGDDNVQKAFTVVKVDNVVTRHRMSMKEVRLLTMDEPTLESDRDVERSSEPVRVQTDQLRHAGSKPSHSSTDPSYSPEIYGTGLY